MKTNIPDRKVKYGATVGVIATAIVYGLGQFGIDLTNEVAAGVVVVVIVAAEYIIADPRVREAIEIIEAQKTDGNE